MPYVQVFKYWASETIALLPLLPWVGFKILNFCPSTAIPSKLCLQLSNQVSHIIFQLSRLFDYWAIMKRRRCSDNDFGLHSMIVYPIEFYFCKSCRLVWSWVSSCNFYYIAKAFLGIESHHGRDFGLVHESIQQSYISSSTMRSTNSNSSDAETLIKGYSTGFEMLRHLSLASNALQTLAGIEVFTQLTCLHLHQNRFNRYSCSVQSEMRPTAW